MALNHLWLWLIRCGEAVELDTPLLSRRVSPADDESDGNESDGTESAGTPTTLPILQHDGPNHLGLG